MADDGRASALLDETTWWLRDSESKGLFPADITLIGSKLLSSGAFEFSFHNSERSVRLDIIVSDRLVEQFMSKRGIGPEKSVAGRASLLATSLEEELFAYEWDESSRITM
jgi:hypothetical protein